MEQNPSKEMTFDKFCKQYFSKEFLALAEQNYKKIKDSIKQPQPGDIVEYMIATNDDVVRVGWWVGERLISDCATLNGNKKYRSPIAVWRWPGEKEWRR